MLGHVRKCRRSLSFNSRVEKGLIAKTVNGIRFLVWFAHFCDV
jgi:hypothetical protein